VIVLSRRKAVVCPLRRNDFFKNKYLLHLRCIEVAYMLDISNIYVVPEFFPASGTIILKRFSNDDFDAPNLPVLCGYFTFVIE